MMSIRPVASALDIIIAFALLASAIIWLDRRIRQWRGRDSEQLLAAARAQIIAYARNEASSHTLRAWFESFLQRQSDGSFAALMVDGGPSWHHERLQLQKSGRAYRALCDLGWATPESLQGRTSSIDLTDLDHYLEDAQIGLFMAIPRGSPTPSLLVALGARQNDRPFGYAEVNRLQNMAELMDNILTHSHVLAESALRARVEHLALMSRGLAHDLKNLITPVSSFLVHTDGRFPAQSAEAEVHAAARHSVRVMTDYVRESLFFAEKLQPNFERLDVGRLLASTTAVVQARADGRHVALTFESTCHEALEADAVLLQRLLANLINNAVDASSAGQVVEIAASPSPDHGVAFRVADQGVGIAAANLLRIFEPYFTTKQFGDEVRGFGLGLTICQKIAHLHGGKIDITSTEGKGTTVTVALPPHPLVPAALAHP